MRRRVDPAPSQPAGPMIGPGWFDRTEALARLGRDPVDVLIVGGGITGAGCALDAASRGLRTGLVEATDFAAGTSSKSSKLIHGGLRYLQQGELRLVYEALAERQRLTRNAPHLVAMLPFLIPVFTGRDGLVNPKLARALGSAMWAYDLTGGARIGKLHRRIDTETAAGHMPTLRRDRLAPSYLYYDARADDARLTLAIARTAAIDHGAAVANQARLTAIHRGHDDQVQGATVTADGTEIEVRCAAVVNAAGVWADRVRTLDEGHDPDSIRPAKGIHLTVPWRLVRNDIAVVVPVPGDKRSVFVVPWGDHTYIGTTDTDYDGPLEDPQCTPEDIAYLLTAVNAAMDGEITAGDVTGTWAGLRPLVKSDDGPADTSGGALGDTAGDGVTSRTADLSRRHRVATSDSGVVTITGGKLTTYREMAADTIDAVIDGLGDRLAGRNVRASRTRKLALRGAAGYAELARAEDPLTRHLAGRYGGEAEVLLALCEADPTLGQPLVAGLDYRRAEVVHAARHEMARTVSDVLERRTRALLLDRSAAAEAAPVVADLLGGELGWDATRRAEEVDAFTATVDRERDAAGLSGALDASLGA